LLYSARVSDIFIRDPLGRDRGSKS
jgi:hypothetical protein